MPLSMLYFLAVTPLSLVQVGLAISIASAVALPAGPMIGAVVDRIGAKQVLLAGNLLQAVGFFAYLVTESFAAVLVWTVVVTDRPDRVLGLLRQHRHRHLPAGGARALVRLPRRPAQRRLRRRRARVGHRDLDRHRPGLPGRGRGQRHVVRRRPVAPARGSRPAARRRARPAARLLGDGGARPALPAARGRPGRLLRADDGPQLRAARVRRDRARAARLGHRCGVHPQLPDDRLRPGPGRQRDDRARALPAAAADPGRVRRVVRRLPRRLDGEHRGGDGGHADRRRSSTRWPS